MIHTKEPPTNPKRKTILQELVDQIRETITSLMDLKKQTMIINWLRDFCKYIAFSTSFKPNRLRKYNPGDIIDVNFGYNVGSEINGPHFAIVVEDNNRRDGNVVVIPLSSYSNTDKIHPSEVDLGVLSQLNEYRKSQKVKGTKARISQIRSISKMRIYFPKRAKESLSRLSNEQLQLIYDQIQTRYCSNFPNSNG